MDQDPIWLSPESTTTLIRNLKRIRELNRGQESVHRCDAFLDRLQRGQSLTRGMLSWIKSNCIYWSLPQVPAMRAIVLDTKSRKWWRKNRPHPGRNKVHYSDYDNHKPGAQIVGAPPPPPPSPPSKVEWLDDDEGEMPDFSVLNRPRKLNTQPAPRPWGTEKPETYIARMPDHPTVDGFLI
jgi:hypothetical protein